MPDYQGDPARHAHLDDRVLTRERLHHEEEHSSETRDERAVTLVKFDGGRRHRIHVEVQLRLQSIEIVVDFVEQADLQRVLDDLLQS